MKNPPSNLKPGTPAPDSGLYREIGPRGGQHREVTVPAGHILPPTTMPGSSYTLETPADNQSGRK